MKTNTLKFWHGIVITAIIAILFIKGCRLGSTVALNSVLDNYKDTVMFLKTKSGEEVAYNKALKLSFNNFKAAAHDSIQLLLSDLGMKKTDYITIIRTEIQIDSIPSVPLNITPSKFDTSFRIKHDHYDIYGRLTNESLSLQRITIPNTSTIIVGDRKPKFFSKREYIVTVTNSNPFLNTTGLQSYTFQEKNSRFSIGPSIGYGFYFDPKNSTVGHGFTASIGIGYRLIGWKKK